MDINQMIARVKAHPEYCRVGMILTHVGVVREFSRNGRNVSGVTLSVDRGRIDPIVAEQKQTPGIVEILVEITDQQELAVGDEIMAVVVAGDIRENVLSVMGRTIDAIKQTVTQKAEHFIE
ncbi:MAG: molybdenum cofactor biosynthesis protein MoaE [Thermodesulfobacteriota bacterium]